MENPFDHFSGFLLAVYNHLFTLLAGCVLTVILNFIEKHTPLKGKMTWKVDLAIVLCFLFFACFQAWHDQYELTSKLQTDLNAKPSAPQIQVNVPSPQVVIEHMPGDASPGTNSVVQIQSIGPAKDGDQIAIGKKIAENVFLENRGPKPVSNLITIATLTVAAASEEQKIRKKFEEQVQLGLQQTKNMSSTDLGVEVPQFTTAVSPILTEPDVDSLLSGTKRLYLQVWVGWKDSNGSRGKLSYCAWQVKPTLSGTINEGSVLHSCEVKP